MGLPVFTKCCCLELKWGALIVAIVDILLCFGSSGISTGLSGIMATIWLVCLIIHVAHFIACILVAVSVWVQKKNLVILYLITGLLRVIIDIVFVIFLCLKYELHDNILIAVILLTISIVIGIYFWFVIYSWFRKLGGSTPAD